MQNKKYKKSLIGGISGEFHFLLWTVRDFAKVLLCFCVLAIGIKVINKNYKSWQTSRLRLLKTGLPRAQ